MEENKNINIDENLKDEMQDAEQAKKEKKARQLNQVVCICNGIKLGAVLRGIKGCQSVADVNKKVGTGSGGCKGTRCGPRIKVLLKKIEDKENKKADQE